MLCLLIAFPFAYWLAVKVPARWKGVLLGLIIVPFWTSFLIRTIAWRIVLAPKGLLSQLAAAARRPQRAAVDPRHPPGRADRRRLQLPAAHDLPVVRDARPARSGAAGGEQGPRGQPVADVRPGDAATLHARRGGRAAARVHPAGR